jgi:hypothetical protein
MFTLNGFLIGLTMIGLGILGVKYTFWLHNLTGPQTWLENYTGSGSTYGIYKIASVFVVIVGILWATGFGHDFMSFLLTPIINTFAHKQ